VTSRGVLLAGVWAAAALAVPWVSRGPSTLARALGAIGWATVLVAATGLLGGRAGAPGTGSLLLGAAVAVGLAIARPPGRAPAHSGVA
jgi:hypothetical protein